MLIVVVVVMWAGVAWGWVVGSSNLSLSSYPEHSCRKPYPPFDDYDLDRYKRCISEYIEGAANDQKRITEKANEAVEEYNKFVRSLQY